MKRTASAVWNGGKAGNGIVSAPGGALKDTQYSIASRFENGAGTNPEELIAAAHAGCFSMALSLMLEGEGFPSENIKTTATLDLDKVGDGWTISGIHLDTTAKIAGIDDTKFQEIAEKAKAGCPVSRALASVNITMTAKLEA
ncbi:MAG: OsmC family protein [Bacteroidota bacterium]